MPTTERETVGYTPDWTQKDSRVCTRLDTYRETAGYTPDWTHRECETDSRVHARLDT